MKGRARVNRLTAPPYHLDPPYRTGSRYRWITGAMAVAIGELATGAVVGVESTPAPTRRRPAGSSRARR